MKIKIFCDQMPNGWNYNTCFSCKHFSLSMGSKGDNWKCSLNNKSVAQKRAFYSVWVTEYLRGRGHPFGDDEIIIDYIAPKKRKKPSRTEKTE